MNKAAQIILEDELIQVEVKRTELTHEVMIAIGPRFKGIGIYEDTTEMFSDIRKFCSMNFPAKNKIQILIRDE